MIDAFESCRLYILAGRAKFGESVWSETLASLRKQKRTVESPISRMKIPHGLKLRLYADQQGKCNICHEPFPISRMVGDHKIALAIGGTNHHSNYQLACQPCNSAKGANDLVRESKRLGGTVLGKLLGGN